MDGKSQKTGEHDDTEEVGLSLEELGQTYARMMGSGEVPYQSSQSAQPTEQSLEFAEKGFDPLQDELIESDQCPITPLSILEAVLFVGRPDSKPVAPEEVASMMRGVRSQEICELVNELNQVYANEGHAMRIAATGGGYRMQLDESLDEIRQRFYGKVRETRLSQSAIDCLALVAYQPGITREEIDQQRGEASSGVLNQLVRRELVEMRRESDKKCRLRRYYPTQRLLKITGLNSLDELPQVEDWN